MADPLCGRYERDEERGEPCWNGEPCEARCVSVLVCAPRSANGCSRPWYSELVGRRRNAVEVWAGDTFFHLDDEPYFIPGGLELPNTATSPGWHGWAWSLLTRHQGRGDYRLLGLVEDVQSREVPSWLR